MRGTVTCNSLYIFLGMWGIVIRRRSECWGCGVRRRGSMGGTAGAAGVEASIRRRAATRVHSTAHACKQARLHALRHGASVLQQGPAASCWRFRALPPVNWGRTLAAAPVGQSNPPHLPPGVYACAGAGQNNLPPGVFFCVCCKGAAGQNNLPPGCMRRDGKGYMRHEGGWVQAGASAALAFGLKTFCLEKPGSTT